MSQYIVQPNDTLEKICESFGVDNETMVKSNHLVEEEELIPGMILFIPLSVKP